jgi:hypothetical protein
MVPLHYALAPATCASSPEAPDQRWVVFALRHSAAAGLRPAEVAAAPAPVPRHRSTTDRKVRGEREGTRGLDEVTHTKLQ